MVVLGGDFRQIYPVIPHGCRKDVIHATINSSYLWQFCQLLTLLKNKRLSIGSTESSNNGIKEFSD